MFTIDRMLLLIVHMQWRTLFSSFAAVVILTSAAYAANPLVLDQGFTMKILGRHMDVLEDPEARLTIADAASTGYSDAFRPSPDRYPNFSYSSSSYWIRFSVLNTAAKPVRWYLEFAPPWVDHVDLYIPSGSSFRVVKSGESLPFTSREVNYRDFAFPLDTAPGLHTYYLRLDSGGSTLNLALTAWSIEEFLKMMKNENSILFMYYGLMLAMLIINLFIALSIQDRSYYYYILLIAAFTLYTMTYEGTAYQYLWPGSVWWAKRSLIFFLLLSTSMSIQFTRSFLETPVHAPRMDALLTLLLCISIPGMIILLLWYTFLSDPIAVAIGVTGSAAILMAGLIVLLKGFRPAKFFLSAFAILLFGIFLNSLRAMGLINDSFFTLWGFEIGASSLVILLSFALSDRINTTRKNLALAHLEMLELNKIVLEERERLLVTLRSIGDGVITTDLRHTVILMNQVAERLTGWTAHEAAGKEIGSVLSVADETTRRRSDSKLLEVLSHDKGHAKVRAILVASDGVERLVSFGCAPIRNRDSKTIGTVLVMRDITEQQKMEDDIIRASKIESLGILAGGIAHDFNNILTVIMGCLSIAKMNMGDREKLIRHITKAEDYSCQAKNLTQQLLTFSKGGEPLKSPVDISRLLLDMTGFVMSGSNVKIEFSLAGDLMMVEADESQVFQVFNNLIINAIQAMPEGGLIRVHGENVNVGQESGRPLREGWHVRISVKDLGPGIPRENLQKIFDPYFTTKETGTGLGLTSAYSIIKKHNGCIEVDSTKEGGSVFTVYLPAIRNACAGPEPLYTPALGGKGRILIMDDEESILEVAGTLLDELGYESYRSRDGAEALELYKQAKESGNRFDAVIMDLTIPGGIGGKLAIQMIREYDAGARCIVSSGYSNDPIMSSYEEYGFCGMVAKPYKAEELSEVLKRVLTENGGPYRR